MSARLAPARWVAALVLVLMWLALAPGVVLGHPSAGTRVAARAEPLSLPVMVPGQGVVVRAEAGLDQLAHEVAARAPERLARIARELDGLPVPARIEIRLVKQAADLPRVAPPGRGAPAWASGVAYPDLGIAAVATRRAHETIDALRVTDHELAHLALGAALGGRAPRWLDEGFAFVHAPELSMGRTQTLVGMAWSGDVATLGALERSFYGDPVGVDRAYAQSYDFVSFLARRGRYPDMHDDGDPWPFRRFLAEIGAGRSPDDAARDSYGAPLGRLWAEWAADLRARYLLVPGSLVAFGVWALAALLLVLGYLRRRRLNRITMNRWEAEEAAARARLVMWPGAEAANSDSSRPESGPPTLH
ncbi:peptidase MA family metallohydrolase [Haliangium sp.]|uniref:peptidase MA family metallohydrolase n=1 Tax=Haliangium sp. TaxID=2663208 RepID=UPI003D0F9A48